jgi:hypothetical protein
MMILRCLWDTSNVDTMIRRHFEITTNRTHLYLGTIAGTEYQTSSISSEAWKTFVNVVLQQTYRIYLLENAK